MDSDQTTIFDFLDVDEPGSLCRHAGAAMYHQGKKVPAPEGMAWVDFNRFRCRCGRTVTVRTDNRLPRHDVPVR